MLIQGGLGLVVYSEHCCQEGLSRWVMQDQCYLHKERRRYLKVLKGKRRHNPWVKQPLGNQGGVCQRWKSPF